jgi:hypothetical protein
VAAGKTGFVGTTSAASFLWDGTTHHSLSGMVVDDSKRPSVLGDPLACLQVLAAEAAPKGN